MNEIPSKFENEILHFPEYSYGVARITIFLDDGRTFSDVFVAWGKEIVRVGMNESIPFNPERIVKVKHQ